MISRRALLAGLGALRIGCSKRERSAPPEPAMTSWGAQTSLVDAGRARGATRLLTMNFDLESGPETAVVLVPTWGALDALYPVVVALHGRGEAMKGPDLGAMGWPRDYALTRAVTRICSPPLTPEDLEGFVDPERLAKLNDALVARPFGGLIVACPYVPDLNLASDSAMRAYGRFLVDVLLPRVRRETPALANPQATGIDGVSLGGITALRVGLNNPEAFGAVGGLQPAVGADQAAELTVLARAARTRNPGLSLRLLTSTEDMYRVPIRRISEAWGQAAIAHEFVEIPGPHDYPFNRGPGAYELLAWHDRVLRKG